MEIDPCQIYLTLVCVCVYVEGGGGSGVHVTRFSGAVPQLPG